MDWFENWFDSPYYHQLYRKRNTAEAQLFLKNILGAVTIPQNASVLDIACGRGRHSRFLHSRGYTVTGIDLSINSIEFASQFSTPTLRFKQMDMRHIQLEEPVDLAVNMFTSFGYFSHTQDNIKVLQGVHKVLRENGLLVIDFLNAQTVTKALVAEEQITIEGVNFCINRTLENNQIVKRIDITDGAWNGRFFEKVSAFSLADFEQMFSETNFRLKHVFGDYDLHPFQPDQSKRLILVAQKM